MKYHPILFAQDDLKKCRILGHGQKEGEDDIKKAKKRQAMMDNIGVLVATVIMVVLALVIILLKVGVEELIRFESGSCQQKSGNQGNFSV